MTTLPDALLSFGKSNMNLNVHSDTLYLCEPKAKSRTRGHFLLPDHAKEPRDNGAVLNIANIMKDVMSPAAEAELGALFLNPRQALPARTTLFEMGHPQPPTPIQTDNTAPLVFVGKYLIPKATKSTYMQHWWMRNRSDQKQFR